MTNTKKRKPRKPCGTQSGLAVKSELRMSKKILPWEFDLLTTVLNVVKEAQNADSQQTVATQ